MTALLLYDACLVELNKVDAPNMMLEDFNTLANKAINNYVNKKYNVYDMNQQTGDDLGVLKASAILPVKKVETYKDLGFMDATYEVILPSDYLHLLNCECIYKVNRPYKCYTPAKPARAKATRLTADLYSQVLDNCWNCPSYKRPYYYIHNVNKNTINPTNPYGLVHPTWDEDSSDSEEMVYSVSGTDGVALFVNNGIRDEEYVLTKIETIDDSKFYKWEKVGDKDSAYYTLVRDGLYRNSITLFNSEGSEVSGYTGMISSVLPRTINLKDLGKISNVERTAGVRYGNVSEVRMEIRYGTDDLSVFTLTRVIVDYIKTPQHFLITQEQLDRTEDTSQMLEFPDYVCQEIINELVHIIMERNSDSRLNTHPLVSLSIANPAQQLTVQSAAAAAQ